MLSFSVGSLTVSIQLRFTFSIGHVFVLLVTARSPRPLGESTACFEFLFLFLLFPSFEIAPPSEEDFPPSFFSTWGGGAPPSRPHLFLLLSVHWKRT